GNTFPVDMASFPELMQAEGLPVKGGDHPQTGGAAIHGVMLRIKREWSSAGDWEHLCSFWQGENRNRNLTMPGAQSRNLKYPHPNLHLVAVPTSRIIRPWPPTLILISPLPTHAPSPCVRPVRPLWRWRVCNPGEA